MTESDLSASTSLLSKCRLSCRTLSTHDSIPYFVQHLTASVISLKLGYYDVDTVYNIVGTESTRITIVAIYVNILLVRNNITLKYIQNDRKCLLEYPDSCFIAINCIPK